jgi:hypothetical protein
MEMTIGVWALAAGVVGAAAYLLRVLTMERGAEFQAGAVSQSWLTEHRNGSHERFR